MPKDCQSWSGRPIHNTLASEFQKLRRAAFIARQWLGSGKAADDPKDQEVWEVLNEAIEGNRHK